MTPRTHPDVRRTKSPYDGALAFTMGWPCVPPYQMRSLRKMFWQADWRGAQSARLVEPQAAREKAT